LKVTVLKEVSTDSMVTVVRIAVPAAPAGRSPGRARVAADAVSTPVAPSPGFFTSARTPL
jgi:hypothetical protein